MRRTRLAIEFAVVFFGLPVAYATGALGSIPLIPTLWGFAAICVAVLAARGFRFGRLWDVRSLARRLPQALLPCLLAAPWLALVAAWLVPERMFEIARQHFLVWAGLMIAYPVLSVVPQGVVFRTFILERYAELFPRTWVGVLASASAFAAVHLVYANWLAPALTFPAGLLFASTHVRSGSPLAATLQHALLGCLLFTLGLGWYFGSRAGLG